MSCALPRCLAGRSGRLQTPGFASAVDRTTEHPMGGTKKEVDGDIADEALVAELHQLRDRVGLALRSLA
jgi:hypothetical protein